MAPMIAALAAGGAVGGVAVAAGASTAAAVLGGVSTAFSALSALRQGQAQAAQMRGQAMQAQLEATQERIDGQRTRNALTGEMLDQLGTQRAALGANGVELSSPLALRTQARTQSEAETELAAADRGARMRALSRRYQARQLYASAKDALNAGTIGALSEVAGGMTAAYNRGGIPKSKK